MGRFMGSGGDSGDRAGDLSQARGCAPDDSLHINEREACLVVQQENVARKLDWIDR